MDKTYVFSNEPSSGCCGGSKLDITALLPNLMGGNRGVDPNVLALMNGNGGFGGQNGIWGVIYLLKHYIISRIDKSKRAKRRKTTRNR